ncbi:MAG: hypothetical protein CR986_02785 [Ignavibacteriae bacterium]|nr:MAG: hypothetical protein CR986_02785 [Ignavibacteriota bacterium]
MKKTILLILIFTGLIFSQSYKDQFYSFKGDSLINRIETISGLEISQDSNKIIMSENTLAGYVIFKPDTSLEPFNKGLPSWNGHSPSGKSSFRVLIRFYKNGWSVWLTLGYWKNNLWSNYGATYFNDGKISIDYAELNSYYRKWQFKVEMKRTAVTEPSPSIHRLNFFVSDSRTTANLNINNIVNDKPNEIFIETKHYYQYSLDPNIGKDICSPTSVAMAIKSYGLDIDPLQFARDNEDRYWGMFGIWPRAVQNAYEHGLIGEVTRYRTWSEAYNVLKNGGRVVMSVSRPLYKGHLMMLAGFDNRGNPLVHDPAKSNGYKYLFDKRDLSKSWFNKGGIAYTFYLDSNNTTDIKCDDILVLNNEDYKFDIYPNPFNPSTNIRVQLNKDEHTEIKVYSLTGEELTTLYKGELRKGIYNFNWNASSYSSGMYLFRVVTENYAKTLKAFLIK